MFRPGNLGHLGRLGLVAASRNAFNPLSLFAAGEQGVWYDPSDLSTLFQDAAGTTPVTAAGQPVGRMLDKSGRGNHATQSTAINRPTLQIDAGGRYYLACDGVDDGMSASAIDLTSTNKLTVFAGIGKLRNSPTESIVELGSSPASGPGTFWINSSGLASGDYWIAMAKNVSERTGFSSVKSAPTTDVLSVLFDFSGTSRATEIFPRINGSIPSLTGGLGATAGDSNFGNNQLFLFRRFGSSLPFKGSFYGLILRGATSTADQITNAERWLAAKTGVNM